jgi:Fibronectin type III domain
MFNTFPQSHPRNCLHFFKFHLIFLLASIAFFISCPAAFSAEIRLAWDPNTESDLAGYKVYYGTSARTGTDPKSCGLCSYSTIVPVSNVTTYTLSNLVAGQTYYFSVTAYDTSNNESGFSNEVSGAATNSAQTRIALKAGPNLLSFPNLPGEVPLTSLLSSISGQYDSVSAYEGCDQADPWKIYDPAVPSYVNDLQSINPTMGVWIEMTQDSELNVSGSYPLTLSISLCTGWNLISYAGNQVKPISDALSSIAGKYLKVYTYKASDPTDPWKIFDSSVPPFVNDLTTLEPGAGYWINVNQNCTFVINN